MSGQRAAAEPYTTRFETEVTAVDGRQVRLERSYFYGESGGQPADRGSIGEYEVVAVQLVDGEQVHHLAAEPSFSPGRRVLCSIDRAFRLYCLRAHTASHVLYGAGRRLLEDLGYAGFDIGEQKVRVDLETPTPIDDETMIDLERLVNRVVWESRPVSWESVPVGSVRDRSDVAFNDATEDGALEDGRVRLVTIGGKDKTENGHTTALRNGSTGSIADGDGSDNWDVAACGGTHVRNTREIGPVTVLGRSNPGEGKTRLELAVGPMAIDRRAAEKRAAFDAKRVLGTSIDAVGDEAARLVDDREALTDQLRERERELVAERLERASTIDRDDEGWLLADVGDVPTDVVSDVVQEQTDDEGVAVGVDDGQADVVIAVGQSDTGYAVVGAVGSQSATAVLEEITATVGGGGGGSAQLAQGGGFDAGLEDVRRALE
ncbi:hypothetical protein D8Y22_17045 [Salinadaptatus halalkaliphilus]|uniref:Alanyl-transfer RNA synthetases family profile domain-containing protein n=1 Tax=Salinadaptatus halalkaliphilus TaxID=2419781 RepID=A0A4S3TJV8_9EURY|nr:alanine--tRNA ligase-related protein [Salinadaptatus halalkaliphilus]THE63533.1 hypothetical protein D8Y22_17045 [Salinadaptatus halalkaliphilus]